MNKTWIGIACIVAGILYGSMAIDDVYAYTLGWLVENKWITPPPEAGKDDLKNILGRKPTILLYAGILIIIGLFILWNRNS
jgi:1,4-dihydroxy-2-naphthoate octaprenyltransferase